MTIDSNAIFSKDRRYRYVLWRIWDNNKPILNFIGLNPSTADENEDDPTMRRCTSFARELCFGGFYMTNLFAYRTPYPSELLKAKDPVGKDNDQWIVDISNKVDKVVLAWGTKGALLGRDKIVYEKVKTKAYCLEYTKHGFPKHPLYIKSGIKMKRYQMQYK